MDRLNLPISSTKTSISLGIHPATNHMYEAECHSILSFDLLVFANHTRGQEPNNKSKYHGKAAGAVPSSGAAQRNKRKEAAIAKGHGTQSDFAAT